MLGFAGKAMKFGGEAFHASGLDMYFNITSATDVAKTSAETYKQYLTDSWNNNPNTYSNLGMGIAGVAGNTIMAGSMWSMWGMGQLNAARGKGLAEATKFGNGKILTALELQKLPFEAKSALGKGTTGWLKNEGGFKRKLPGGGLKAGLIGAGISMGVSVLGSMALGLAGQVMDQEHQFTQSRKRMYYDTRYFNTGRDEQSLYQTIGSAMQDYDMKMVSSARVMHSRG